jgi:ribosome modulation factor
MQMPNTDNIHFQYAFKKGYRMAIDGKTMLSMPSDIRKNMQMRDYFQQGWEQAVEDMTALQEARSQPNWRERFIWVFFMILAGVATAYLMIHNIESEKTARQPLPQTPENTIQSQPNKKLTESKENSTKFVQLSLLTDEQRSDLEQNIQERKQVKALPLSSIVESSIKISQAVLTNEVVNRSPVETFDEFIPKYIRNLSFFTELKSDKKQTIYHRWRTKTQILATIKLSVEKGRYRTWSSKKLSSAWQGQWYVEVLDSNKNVIYRKSFYYGTQQE